jgi:hypothetical protein
MPVPRSLIVPDPRPPSALLLGAGVLLLAGLVIRTLRRRRGRASSQGSRRGSSQGAVLLGTWRPVVAEASVPMEIPLMGRARSEEGAQKRGRAAKKQP